MLRKIQWFTLSIVVLGLAWAPPANAKKGDKSEAPSAEITATGQPVLWRNPTDITSRNLFYGPGGKDHEPRGTFTFTKEDLDGTSPKFFVRDQDGVKWKVKLGSEARPETVASRLTYAVGYFANEDYFVSRLEVQNLPPHLHRGQKFVASDGSVPNVCLKRYLKGEEKTGIWQWSQFTPREYAHKLGLRWIGRRIPRADAKWIGQLLGQLSPQQIRDAFRAAGYSAPEVEGFAKVVESRISQLQEL
jgi:hypothetical protein